ncbi:MAG: M48 family metallopeptidase [Planctomycetes bacterium]|nr:M48 family metallopeptidase [Planctomycetota bacterium]
MAHRIRWLALGLGLAATLLPGCTVNPITGNEELMFFPPDKDVELGQRYAPQVEKALGGLVPEQGIQSYLHQVGQRIARFCQRPDLAYHFAAVEEGGANAFALPGGYIYITRDLLKELKTEAQLAAVLSHEVGHVVARDTLVAMSEQIGMTALMVAAQTSGSPDAARGTRFVTAVLSLQYSRDDEREADFAGLSYMTQAGYDPNAMVETMETLAKLQTFRPVEFFSTHPNPENRIAYLQDRIATRFAAMKDLKQGQEEYSRKILTPLNERKKRFNLPPQETTGTRQEPVLTEKTGS